MGEKEIGGKGNRAEEVDKEEEEEKDEKRKIEWEEGIFGERDKGRKGIRGRQRGERRKGEKKEGIGESEIWGKGRGGSDGN